MKSEGTPDARQLGLAIRELRYERGMTGEEVALLAEVDVAHLNRAENHGRNLTWITTLRIVGALDVSMMELVERAEAIAARERAEGTEDAD
jgi:transcriptional regulator with XRE-family HTH domain